MNSPYALYEAARLAVAFKLAAEFSRVISEWLTGLMDEVVRLNLTYEPGICATHDFCDANMAMDEACITVLGRSILPADGGGPSDADCWLWSTAWAIAKDAGFEVPAAHEVTP